MSRLDSSAMVDHDDVIDALSNVIDPELGLDFVELGLIYGVEIDGGTVSITFTLTTPACPIGPQVSEQMQEFVGELPERDRGRDLDGVHASVVAREDVRGREVRARLLTLVFPFLPGSPRSAAAASSISSRLSPNSSPSRSRSGIAS